MKKILLTAAALVLLAGSAYAAPSNNKIVSIMYHDISVNPLLYDNYRVSPELLEGDIQQFLDNGYTFLRAGDMTEEYITAHENDKFVCLTFDDGYTSFYTQIYPLLKKYNVPASFYIITSRIDRYNHMSAEQIKELSDSGLVEIGTHTNYIHLNDVSFIRQMYDDPVRLPDAVSDFGRSIAILEEITGKKITSAAYPNGIYNYAIDERLRTEYGINVTISTDFGVMDESLLGAPLRRINRDMYYTPQQFFERVESCFDALGDE